MSLRHPVKTLSCLALISLLVAGCSNNENLPFSPSQDATKESSRLKLSLPEEGWAVNHQDDTLAEFPSSDILPDLFEEKASDTKISGHLIVDNQSEHYLDAIKGAQISIEIKTD